MSEYIEVIKEAVLVFPIIALIITIPYMLYNYHKYGSVIFLKTLIVYSFVLYLLCTYFLVILPLPNYDNLIQTNTSYVQTEPFRFIQDILQEANGLQGINKILQNKSVYQFFFNVLMCIPFGMYLKYYFRCSWIKTTIYSFLLSLFFEITQLTGLYHIFPSSYRLFDVDDLIANTLGGLLGFLICIPLSKLLPTREELDEMSFTKGRRVSLTRRMTSFVIDGLLLGLLTWICHKVVLKVCGISIWSGVLFFFLYATCNVVFNGKTLGKYITNLQIVDKEETLAKWYQYYLRYSVLYLFMKLPTFILWLLEKKIPNPWNLPIIFRIPVAFIVFMWVLVCLVKVSFQESLWYEKLSCTKVVSTIKKGEAE